MPFCETCGEFFYNHHKCPPVFKVFHEDYMGDDFKAFRARSAEGAAEQYAENYDCGDYDLLDGAEIEVIVEDAEGKRITFICTGRTDPVYSATEKEN
jgi:hypothetical protein